jgi:hypothetical protein
MKPINSCSGRLAAVAIIAAGIGTPASALTFVLNDVTPGGMSPEALAGFTQATNIWSSYIGDAITINLDIRFDGNDISGSPLGGTILGSAGSTTQGLSYTAVRAALVAKATTADDAVAVANLPAGPALSFLTNDATTGNVVTDNNGTSNNTILNVNTANAKALGLRSANNSATDAGIAFNSSFSWDFDQSDGVGAGLQDFVGVTVHEIGHALGFVSGVDDVDVVSNPDGPSAPIDLDTFRVVTVWDLYRYSAAGQLDYAYGGAPYFSIDGGTTSLGTFSTGAFNGDGRQASHWKDNLGLGLMDPTANNPNAAPPGNENHLGALDLMAFDVIGYQLIPEASSSVLVLLGGCLAFRRRRS